MRAGSLFVYNSLIYNDLFVVAGIRQVGTLDREQFTQYIG